MDGLLWYYLATPLFALADLGLGLPVRVAGLEDPAHRALYYVGVFGLALVARARPAAVPWMGMLESSVSILLLVLAVMLPIWGMPEAALAGQALEGPFDRVSLANFLLSGTALVWSFQRHRRSVG